MELLLMAAAAWGLFLAAASGAFALVYPLLRRGLARLHPYPRTISLRLAALAPVGLATLGVLLCFAPKLFGSVLSRTDHCHAHADAHPHFCLEHPPQFAFPSEAGLALVAFALAGLALAAVKGRRLRRSAALLRQLSSTARFDAGRRVWVVDTEVPLALSVGVLRPRTLLSSGLLRRIPPRLAEAVVAHEHAHARRRDGLWKPITELLGLGHLPPSRRALTADLDLACEQACDEEAGRVLGERTRVAEALLAMERLRRSLPATPPAALAFGAHGLAARVESLVSDSPGRSGSRGAALGLALLGLLAAALAADPLHHLTETLLHHVLG